MLVISKGDNVTYVDDTGPRKQFSKDISRLVHHSFRSIDILCAMCASVCYDLHSPPYVTHRSVLLSPWLTTFRIRLGTIFGTFTLTHPYLLCNVTSSLAPWYWHLGFDFIMIVCDRQLVDEIKQFDFILEITHFC